MKICKHRKVKGTKLSTPDKLRKAEMIEETKAKIEACKPDEYIWAPFVADRVFCGIVGNK